MNAPQAKDTAALPLCSIEQSELRSEAKLPRMHNAPWPAELCFDTDQFGAIIAWTEEALRLIRYEAKGAAGRSLALFFGYDRPGTDQFEHVLRGHPIERDGVIRPRERRPVPVRYRIELAPDSTDRFPILRWTFGRLNG